MYVNEDGKMHFYIFCLFRSSQNFREEISKPIIQLMKLGMRSLKICHSMGLYYEKKKNAIQVRNIQKWWSKIKGNIFKIKNYILYSW